MNTKRSKIILSVILYLIAAICGFFFIHEYDTAQEEIAEYTQLQEAYTETAVDLLSEDAADP